VTAATGVCHELGWNKSYIDVKVGAYCTIEWPLGMGFGKMIEPLYVP